MNEIHVICLSMKINKLNEISSYFRSYFGTLDVRWSNCRWYLIRIFTLSKAIVDWIVVGFVAQCFSACDDDGIVEANVSLAT